MVFSIISASDNKKFDNDNFSFNRGNIFAQN